jgi:hypothetical protein
MNDHMRLAAMPNWGGVVLFYSEVRWLGRESPHGLNSTEAELATQLSQVIQPQLSSFWQSVSRPNLHVIQPGCQVIAGGHSDSHPRDVCL